MLHRCLTAAVAVTALGASAVGVKTADPAASAKYPDWKGGWAPSVVPGLPWRKLNRPYGSGARTRTR